MGNKPRAQSDWSNCLPLANDAIPEDRWDEMFRCLREKTVEVSSNGNKHNIYLHPDNAKVKPPKIRGWLVEFIINGVHEPVSADNAAYEWGRFLYDCYVHKGEEFVAAWRNILLSENTTFIRKLEQRWMYGGFSHRGGDSRSVQPILLYELEIILRVGGPELAMIIILNGGNSQFSDAAKACGFGRMG